MNDPNAIIAAVVPIAMPTIFSALGQVTVAGLWSQPVPGQRLWRGLKPPRGHGWKATSVPDQHTGRF
jgi:hypothetical protein